MFELCCAVFLFLAAHMLPAYASVRERMIATLSLRVYMSLYGLSSAVLFVWVISAYQRAPYMGLWLINPLLHAMAMVLMALACLLIVTAFLQPNPFSLGRGAQGFDPDKPGIVGLTCHPAFLAFATWAVAHILVKGDVAALIFFGSMAALSVYGPYSLDQKRKQTMGIAEWQHLRATIVRGPPFWGWKEGACALVLFATLALLHGPLLGVMPFWFEF